MNTATATALPTNACVILASSSLGETSLTTLRQEYNAPSKGTARWSQDNLQTLKPVGAAELDGFRNGWVYLLLQTKFVRFGFTFTVNGRHVTVDNYPTIGGEAPTLAELVMYPVEVFDGRLNRAEQRRIRTDRRKSRRASWEGRKKERYAF